MSLTSESRPSSPEPQGQEGAQKDARIDPVSSAHLMHDRTLENYEEELIWWRNKHQEAMEKLVNINRAAVNGIIREINMVRVTRSKINDELDRRRRLWQYSSEDSDESRVRAAAAAAEANVHPLHAPPRHQRDLKLVRATHKVRRANYMALDALQDDPDTLRTLLTPEGPYSSHRRGPYAVPVPTNLPWPLPVIQNVDIQAEQLAYMSGTVRDLVMAGRVYAVQRSVDKRKVRSASLAMMWGHLHLHCLVEEPPPPGSFTVEIYNDQQLLELLEESDDVTPPVTTFITPTAASISTPVSTSTSSSTTTKTKKRASTSTPSASGKRSSKPVSDDTDSIVQEAFQQLKALSSSNDNDGNCDFGNVVANDLRQMSNENKIYAQKLINDILFLGKLGKLSSSTMIVE